MSSHSWWCHCEACLPEREEDAWAYRDLAARYEMTKEQICESERRPNL